MLPRAPTFQLTHADAGAADLRREAMLEAALDCIVTMDADGRVVDFNAAAERTFGYAREEARGRNLGDLIVPPELRARHAAGLARHLASGESSMLGRRLELSALRRDGSRIPVELTVTRTDIDGEPLFIAFLRDLSGLHAAQAALADAEARFRRLVEQVPTVTYLCDYDEQVSVRYISPQIEELTGYAPERWTSDPQFWVSVVHPDDRDWVVAADGAAHAGGDPGRLRVPDRRCRRDRAARARPGDDRPRRRRPGGLRPGRARRPDRAAPHRAAPERLGGADLHDRRVRADGAVRARCGRPLHALRGQGARAARTRAGPGGGPLRPRDLRGPPAGPGRRRPRARGRAGLRAAGDRRAGLRRLPTRPCASVTPEGPS